MSIDIAIIDSGINPWHSHVQGVAGGVSFRLGDHGQVVESDDFRDGIGHGTAIAGVIREKVSEARLYAVRIFQERLEAPIALLVAGLDWAVRNQTKMIHLSLGTERVEYRQELEELCQRAYEQDIVIVAAARGPEDRVYPGVFETVIGVSWDRGCDDDSLVYHPGKPVEFGAFGWPRALLGIRKENNFRGASFAAARVTALAAQLLEQNPVGGTAWVRQALKKTAVGEHTCDKRG